MKRNFTLDFAFAKDRFITVEKKILLFLLLSFCSLTNAQTTLILRPDSSLGKDAFLASETPSANYGNHPELAALGWTCSGNSCFSRSLIQFDLSGLSANAVIIDARLSLFANPTPVNANGIAMQGSDNSSSLQRVTSNWVENSVTWNIQPTTTTVNQVILPQSSSSFQNYQDIDVKSIVQDMVNNPSSSFGFMLKLQNEGYYNSMIFASSDYPDSTVHPKLVIVYLLKTSLTCIDGSTDMDAFLASGTPSTNFGNHPEFAALGWTCSGTPCYARSLFQINLSAVPANATIIDSRISLYANPLPLNSNGIAMQGSNNSSFLQRVTSPWDEQTVTWNTQPTTTSINQIILPQSDSSFQNYLDFDITNMVKDMLNYQDSSFGIMLKMQTEDYYNSMIFASSDFSNASFHPVIEVCYLPATGIAVVNEPPDFYLEIFPNPSSEFFTARYSLEQKSNISIEMFDLTGNSIFLSDNCIQVAGNHEISFNVADFSTGIFLLKINVDEHYIIRKIFVE